MSDFSLTLVLQNQDKQNHQWHGKSNIYKVNQCSRNYATVLGAISAVCRKQAAVSHIVLTKISKKFVLFGMLPYLCIVNQTKQVLGDAKQEN